jgi:hypothetical protein
MVDEKKLREEDLKGRTPAEKKAKFDLVDWRTKGQLETEKDESFAILRLWNGAKALIATHRVWINDKPKFGAWRALQLSYFK